MWRTVRRSSIRPVSPSARFSQTLRGPIRLKCWCTMASPSEAALNGSAMVTACPLRRISPTSGVTRPRNMFIRVVFPAPFWPRIPWISPRFTVRSTRSHATTAPNRLVSDRASSDGAGEPRGSPAPSPADRGVTTGSGRLPRHVGAVVVETRQLVGADLARADVLDELVDRLLVRALRLADLDRRHGVDSHVELVRDTDPEGPSLERRQRGGEVVAGAEDHRDRPGRVGDRIVVGSR